MKKKMITMLFACFVFLFFCGCTVNKNEVANERYIIKTIENKPYLIIDDGTIESIQSEIDVERIQVASIQFDSIDEFVNTVKSGKLNDEQLAIANKTFKKDENGIKVCDFSNIQIPSVPPELECKTVYWSGERYSFCLESVNDDTVAYVYLLDKSTYDYKYENDYLRFFENELVTTTKVIENKNKTEYYYSTAVADLKNVRYTVTDAETNLVIDESYCLRNENSNVPTSQDVPYRITVYGVKSDVYFCIMIFDIANKPTTEWITQLGVKPYN